MIGLLRRAASELPDGQAVVSPWGESSYQDLLAQADSAAAALKDDVRRIGILEPNPATVVSILAGCAAVGIDACVYPLAATDEAAARLAARLGHEVVVTDRDLETATVSAGSLLAVPAAGLPASDGATLTVLTTGTTGEPKGVRHDWARLLRGAWDVRSTPEQRWLLAYGLNQFGGLQILLHVIGARATLITGRSFQPHEAVETLRKHPVTHISGTPTFWRFLLTELAASGVTPRLEQATISGEAILPDLLERIRARFPDARVSQIYAATEFGQGITVRDGLPGLPTSMLDPGGNVELKIVDEELWVRSTSAMLGYHGEAPVSADDWRPTGDLVEVVGDRIEFRSRRGDVINVGGVKVHPLPIEEVVTAAPGVALARAYGRPNALTGNVVAVEIVLAPGHGRDEVEAAVRDACESLPPAARPRSYRFVETLDVTGSKVRRGGRP